MTDAPAITSLVPWFGSKRRLAARIVAELGEHRAYWEPLCGSMAVLLSKPRVSQETVNDLHGDLINLARCVQDPTVGPRLYRRLRRVVCSDAEYSAAVDQLGGDVGPILDEDRAYWYFVRSWMERSGFAGTAGGPKGVAMRYGPTGGATAVRWRSAVESIPAWRRRLETVLVLRRDAFELLESMAPAGKARRSDLDGVSIYVDPPYLEKGARYTHDFEARPGGLIPDDHERLADLLSRFQKARVVVSYYAHPRLLDLYPSPRWTHVDCSMSRAVANAEGGDATAPEVLIVNGPSYSEGAK